MRLRGIEIMKNTPEHKFKAGETVRRVGGSFPDEDGESARRGMIPNRLAAWALRVVFTIAGVHVFQVPKQVDARIQAVFQILRARNGRLNMVDESL
jgi:hypothetical protein